MRILFLSRCIFKSGVTTHMIDLAESLIKKNHTVYLVTGGLQSQHDEASIILLDKLREIGVQILVVSLPVLINDKFDYFVKMIKFPFILNKLIKTYNFDVLHVHTAALSFAPKLLGKKFITTIHVSKLNLGLLHQKATHEIAISREIQAESYLKFGYALNEVSLIYNGVSKRFVEKIYDKQLLRETFGLPKDKLIVGFVGSLDKRKGLDILFKAISMINESTTIKVHLVLVGDNHNESNKNWMYSLIDDNKLESSISIYPFQDPKRFYEIMDIFVLPSRQEGFPLVTIEAMLSECCVIRSNTEGASDQIIHGKTGFIFENENVEQLVDILLKVISDEVLRKSIAKAGLEKALNEFTSDIMAEKTIVAYQNVLLDNGK